MAKDLLLEAIRARGRKMEFFGYGILTADKYVSALAESIGPDECNRMAARGRCSFDDLMKKAARTLCYSNPDMVLEEKRVKDGLDGVELPKNHLLVFRHVLTSSAKDRDGDTLHAGGAAVDPKMLLLWQHVHTLPIGKCLKIVSQDKDRLKVVSCIVDMNQLSHDAAVMVDNDMGRFSHGFRALEFTETKAGRDGAGGGFDVTRYEIMEESLVSVPANVDAQTEEVILSLVEGGQLKSALMKRYGRALREKRNVQVPGVKIRYRERLGGYSKELTCDSLADLSAAVDAGLIGDKNHENEHGVGGEKAGAGKDGAGASKEADAKAADRQTQAAADAEVTCPECDWKGEEPADGKCPECGAKMDAGKSTGNLELKYWSEAAREASILARAAKRQVKPTGINQESADSGVAHESSKRANEATRVAERNPSAPKLHETAAGGHERAAADHERAAKTRDAAGQSEDSKAHAAAAVAHHRIAVEHHEAAKKKDCLGLSLKAVLPDSWDWVRSELEPQCKPYLQFKGVPIPNDSYVYIHAMFDDHALVHVSSCGIGSSETQYYEVDWQMMEGGEPELVGDPREVDLTESVEDVQVVQQAALGWQLAYKDFPYVDAKPYANEHAARISDPGGYEKIRRQNDKFGSGVHAIWGIDKEGKTALQSIRFSADQFTADDAKKWLSDHDYKTIEFAAATGKSFNGEKAGRVLSGSNENRVKQALACHDEVLKLGEGHTSPPARALVKESKGHLETVLKTMEKEPPMTASTAMAAFLSHATCEQRGKMTSALAAIEAAERPDPLTEQFNALMGRE